MEFNVKQVRKEVSIKIQTEVTVSIADRSSLLISQRIPCAKENMLRAKRECQMDVLACKRVCRPIHVHTIHCSVIYVEHYVHRKLNMV